MNTTKLKQRLAKQGMIAILWSTEDVLSVRPDLSEEQCMKVLEQCQHRHNAEIGINWSVIEFHADDLFLAPDEDDQPQQPSTVE